MKRLLIIVTYLAYSMCAMAQHEEWIWTLQPFVGIGTSFLSDVCNKSRLGMTGGIGLEYGMSDEAGITLRAMYSHQGGEQYTESYGREAKIKNDDMTLWSMIKYYPVDEMAISIGGLIGYNIYNKRMEKTTISTPKEDNLSVRKMMIGIPIGLSVEFSNLVISGEIVIPITRSFKNHGGSHRFVQLTVGYKFEIY